MAASANLSSTFAMFVVPSSNTETTIFNPGRSFRVVGVIAQKVGTTGTTTVTLKTSIGGVDTTIFNTAAVANNTSSLMLLGSPPVGSSGWELGSNDNLKITFSTFAVGTTATILCVATGGGSSLSAV